MLNREDITEYCHECNRTVVITQRGEMGYVRWVCSECGSTIDSYPDDLEEEYIDNGDLYE